MGFLNNFLKMAVFLLSLLICLIAGNSNLALPLFQDDLQKQKEYLICFTPLPIQLNLQNYSRLRDIFRSRPKSTTKPWFIVAYPKIIFVNILATYINATLLTYHEVQQLSQVKKYPEVFPTNSVFWSTLQNYRNETVNITDRIPDGVHIFPVEPILWGFAYCTSNIKQEHNSIWDFGIFLNPFDWCTWVMTAVSFLLVVPFSGKISSVIMSVVSATLSIGTTTPQEKSRVFLMWLGTCMLLANFYSGELTCRLTVPPKEDAMTRFQHLVDHNYTLVLPDLAQIFFTGAVSHFHKSQSRMGKLLKKLLSNVIISEEEMLYETLSSDVEQKLVTATIWPALHTVMWAQKLSLGKTTPKVSRNPVKCYVGEELVKIGENFFVFLPPKNSRLVLGMRRLVEAGIYQRWDQEQHGLLHSGRVQDRVPVKSPTKVLDLEGKSIPARGLKGKMSTMFLLWCVCITISLIVWCWEVSVSFAVEFWIRT